MNLRDTPEEAAFRQEVRSWLREHLPAGWGTPAGPSPESTDEHVAFLKSWQHTLFDGGWAGLHWPEEYGGRAIGIVESIIYNEEYARARAPNMIHLAVGPTLVGPTLIARGEEWQRKLFLPRILNGEDVWCQGFSEPNAGSDLASLRTRGEVRGDQVIVTGQKIWTSFARYADWCILVVRTNADGTKHEGLTFLLADMKTPGITIRPLREMTGESWFNEVFFDAVPVPVKNVVGQIGGGWDIVMTTLAHERGSSSQHAKLAVDLELLLETARKTRRGGRRAADDPVLRQKLARLASEVMALKMTAYRNASEFLRRGEPGPEGSTLKLFWSELDQRAREVAVELLGPRGLVSRGDPLAAEEGFWAHELLWSRAGTIYAGTSEVQRNIIARRALGLPR